MSSTTVSASGSKPLRTLPALVLVFIILLCRYVPRYIEGASSQFWYVPVFFPLLGSLLILIWWLTASRATGRERWMGLVGFIVAVAAVVAASHPSMRDVLTVYLIVPVGMGAFAIAAFLFREQAQPRRLRSILLVTAIALASTLLLRNEGITGAYVFDLKPRWSGASGARTWASKPATTKAAGDVASSIEATVAKAEWPAFRGADRFGHAAGPKLATDWKANPPKLIWKRPVGAAWSSFAVAGSYAFTQEQRDSQETVVCYDLRNGDEVWASHWDARFEEAMGGPGPRATPTLADGAVFAVGGTGILARLKAGTGEIVWKQDAKALSGRAEFPMWGYSSSPLVTNGLVVTYSGGPGEKGLMAFDAKSGELRWSVPCGADSYSSPQLSKLLGEDTLLMLSNTGVQLLDPATGKARLDYAWDFKGYRALQPTVIGDDTILLPTPMAEGTRAIRVSKKDGAWAAEALWTSKQLKTDFAELIAFKGYAYATDGSMFSCIDLKDGQRKWKGGRYGKGQAVLAESSDLFIVSAEDGRVVLVKADPTAHSELASIEAISGKTWNHPVLIGNKLLVRNASEAACYELPVEK